MKNKIRNFVQKVSKIDIEKYFIKFADKIIIIKWYLFSVLGLILVSFLIEYFGFSRHFNQYRFMLILAISLLVSFFVFFRKKIGECPEFGFLVVALICGTLLSFSEQKDYVSWDEQIHYKNSEKMAASIVPGMLFRPNSIESSFSFEEQAKINVYVDGQYKKPKTKTSSIGLAYNRLGYIPSAIAIALGNLANLPFHIVFVLGRWFNLLAYVIIVYFAIGKLKSGKMIMSVVALFPTSIFLAANYGYDSWVIALTLFGLAYLFSEIQQPKKKIVVRDVAIIIGVLVIGLGPKAIYFPLLLLLFLIKKEKFESLKQYRKFILISVASILFVVGSFMLPFVIGGPGKGDSRGGSAVNSAQQVKFILSDPLAYSKILFNFMRNYIDPRNASGFVTFFAYLGMIKGFFLVIMILFIATISDKNEHDRETSNWKTKTLMLFVYLAVVALISTALYIAFTPVKSVTIAGVQPRYLIPLMFPLLFVFGSGRIRNPFNKNIYNIAIFAIMASVLLFGIWDLIISKYY